MAAAYAATTSSMTLLGSRLPTTTAASSRRSALPFLPPRPSTVSFSTSFKQLPESHRLASFQVRASEESSFEAEEVFSDLKQKWDAVENKSTVILYGGGAIVGVWLSSVVVGAINSVPLLPKLLELIGLGYTGWFVYRYLLFKAIFIVCWSYSLVWRLSSSVFHPDLLMKITAPVTCW